MLNASEIRLTGKFLRIDKSRFTRLGPWMLLRVTFPSRLAQYTWPAGAGVAAPGKSPHWLAKEAEAGAVGRSEEHTSELQSQSNLVCRLLLEKKKKKRIQVFSQINTHINEGE